MKYCGETKKKREKFCVRKEKLLYLCRSCDEKENEKQAKIKKAKQRCTHTTFFSCIFFHSSLFFIFRFLLPNYRFHHIAHAHTEESVEQQWAKLQLHERCREWEGERRLRKTNERMNRKQQKRKKPESIPLLSLRRFQCLFLFWI